MMERLGIHGLFAMVNILFSVLFGVVCVSLLSCVLFLTFTFHKGSLAAYCR